MMSTFVFYGLAEEPISLLADNLDAAVSLIETQSGMRLVPAPKGHGGDEVIVTSLGEPDADRFQQAKFEGAFLVLTTIQ